MKKQFITEASRLQKLAGIITESQMNENEEQIVWDWDKARITSEYDDGVVYKVWGTGKLFNYYGQFYLLDSEDGDYNDINDEDIRKEYGNFKYISKWTKDTDELVGEIDPEDIYPDGDDE